MSAFGLVCPCCGEPVRRRAGSERRPHFAHYSHRAKPECENYFPSSGYAAVPLGSPSSKDGQGAWREHQLSCGLFLGTTGEVGVPKLWLRIPSVSTRRAETGSLRIQSGLGLRSFDAAQLSSARLVPLMPQLPLGSATATGDLLPLAARLAAELELFTRGRNLFYADQRGGRLVLPSELLEWGAGYRLLADHPIEPPAALVPLLEWAARPQFAGWHVYEFALPPVFAASRQESAAQIAAFFERKIRAARPRLLVVHPLPHHVDADGTNVYPDLRSSILIRRNANKPVRAFTDAADCVVSVLSDEWLRVSGLPTDGTDCVLSIDGDEQIVLRVEHCALFRPGGVSVRCGQQAWDLTAEVPRGAENLRAGDVTIECPRERLVTYLARLNPGWRVEGLTLLQVANHSTRFDAESFGTLSPSSTDTHAESEELVPRTLVWAGGTPVSRWIEGVVAARFGHAGLAHLVRYLATPDREGLHHLGPLLSTPLMPYILAAHDQVHRA